MARASAVTHDPRQLLRLGLCAFLCACAGRSAEPRAAVAVATEPAPPALRIPAPHATVDPALQARESAAPTIEPPQEIGAAPEIDAAVKSAIAAHKLPGAVVAIGGRSGLRFLRAYGERATVPTREVLTIDTVFDLASVTKPVVTATLLMQLAERGRVDLDARASTYLPELGAHGHGDITVRQLLVHSAGLAAENPLRDYDAGPEAGMRSVFASPQLTAAGKGFRYSDLGYLVLGALIERVTGERLDVVAQRMLFAPLGMHDTRFRPPPEWLTRIAPTESADSVRQRIDPQTRTTPVIRGTVHDPRALRLGGVAGNAGLFATAPDLARYARMLLAGGTLDGARLLSAAGVAAMTAPHFVGAQGTVRALGWDMRSSYSGLRGGRLSHRAFGHGGFTGTSLWIDPDQDLFVILLSNRVHPDGNGYVVALAGELADAAAMRFGTISVPDSCTRLAGQVETGIDVLRAQQFAPLAGKRVALLANDGSRTRDGARTLDVLRTAANVELRALFAAEHGLDRAREGRLASGMDATSALPVHSLFGPTRTPTPEMLRDIDVIVFDLQDAGVRYFTYLSTLRQLLTAAARDGREVVVLDRPNPLGAARIEGGMLDAGRETFVNYHALPLRHGMTAGEIAQMMNEERAIHAKLTVVTMRGYARELPFSQTGLGWYAPSPNLPTLQAIELYPAVALIEGANVSVGRGTEHPFSFVGAPWLDAAALLQRLGDDALAGIESRPLDLTPSRDRYAGKLCHGIGLRVADATRFRATRAGFALASALVAQHRSAFAAAEMGKLVGHARTMQALLAGADVFAMEREWEADLMRFTLRRARYLRYPSCDERAP